MVARLAPMVVLLALAGAASAHEPETSYLRLAIEATRIRGQLDLAVADAAKLLGLEPSVLRGVAAPPLESALLARIGKGLTLASEHGVDCAGPEADASLAPLDEPDLLRVTFAVSCEAEVETLRVGFGLLADLAPTHRVLVSVERAGRHARTAVLRRDAPTARFDLAPPTATRLFADYFGEGLRHIASGPDHVLFLIVLLVPAGRLGGRDAPRAPRRDVIVDVLRTVTAFTVAHSLTLALAALHVVSPDVRLVEAAIAASVVIAALHNVQTRVRLASWPLAGAFGLLHGFGFAAVLDLLGLPTHARVAALFAFNVGVEAGQLVIVAAALPLLLALRHRRFYRTAIVEVPSIAVAWLAAIWLYERVFGVVLLG